jgi:DNA polymerase III epsilon subunit-like protein
LNYVIFDLEYNQIDNRNKRLAQIMQTERPEYLNFEILQIGAVKLNDNLKYVSNFKMYVKPKFLPKINRDIIELLNVSEEYIQINSLYFDKVFNEFKNFIGQDDCTFVTWSNNDLTVLRNNLDAWNIEFETSKYKHIDLQEVVVDKNKLQNPPALERMAKFYDININNSKLHDAYTDASITKQLFQKIGVHGSKPYIDNINFKLNRKIRKHNNDILASEIKKIPHCDNCGKFIKTNIKTKFYTKAKNKDVLYMKKMCYCDKCKVHTFKDYEYKYKIGELSIEDINISNLQLYNKLKGELDFIEQVEKIQLQENK